MAMSTTRPVRKKRRLRWALWRVGWVLLMTAFWSSGRISLSTILDLVVAVVIVAVASILLWRLRCIYEVSKEASKKAWLEGRQEAIRQLARALAQLKQ